jgi:hypothetical protein
MIPPRPAAFAGMADAFTSALGNVDAVFTIDGIPGQPVRAILRQRRDIDMVEDAGQSVEGTVHTLAVDALLVAGITSNRDTVTIDGVVFGIGNRIDDGRAMMRFVLDGNI